MSEFESGGVCVPAGDGSSSDVLHVFTDAEILDVRKKIPQIRDDMHRIYYYFETFKASFPVEYSAVSAKYPDISTNIDRLTVIVRLLSSENTALKDEDFYRFVDDYNAVAKKLNDVFGKIQKEEISNDVFAEEAVDVLSDADKKELKMLAKDLWRKLFPETNVTKFVKWVNDQEELDDWQKYAMALPNGIENVIMGFVSLSDSDTYRDLALSVGEMWGMSWDDWCGMVDGMKKVYENLDTTAQVTPVITLIVSMLTIVGGVSKLKTLLDTSKYSSKVLGMVRGLRAARYAGRAGRNISRLLPVAVISGISVPYIYTNKACE